MVDVLLSLVAESSSLSSISFELLSSHFHVPLHVPQETLHPPENDTKNKRNLLSSIFHIVGKRWTPFSPFARFSMILLTLAVTAIVESLLSAGASSAILRK